MLRIDTLYMVPRDMPLGEAADVLAEVARDRAQGLKRAAILAAAAALNPEAYGREADEAALHQVSEPCDAYEAILQSALASLNAARREPADMAREGFQRAFRIACLADRTGWFASLIYCTRDALERAALRPLAD